jgi:hypothetical protein
MAVSPDGRTLALRFRNAAHTDAVSAPALCDLSTDVLTIPTADESIRSDWLARLIGMTGTLLSVAVPAPNVPGLGMAVRPILLPAPGELTSENPLSSRIARIARIGRSIHDGNPESVGASCTSASQRFHAESRLLFEYLSGNMEAAETAIELLEDSNLTPSERSALLSARAQILIAKGDFSGSQAIIDYLQAQEPLQVRTLEETPLGDRIQEASNPKGLWSRYLSHQLDLARTAQNQRQRVPQIDDSGIAPPRPAEMFEELNRELPFRVPFIFRDPEGGLLIEPAPNNRP